MSKNIEDVIEDVITELERSVVIHGDWKDYDRQAMFKAVRDEFDELQTAWSAGNDYGPHGMIEEARQVAVCCLKMILVLNGRQQCQA